MTRELLEIGVREGMKNLAILYEYWLIEDRVGLKGIEDLGSPYSMPIRVLVGYSSLWVFSLMQLSALSFVNSVQI